VVDANCHPDPWSSCRRCSEKRSREPALRAAANHREAAVRADASTAAALLGRREAAVPPERRFHRR